MTDDYQQRESRWIQRAISDATPRPEVKPLRLGRFLLFVTTSTVAFLLIWSIVA